MTTISQNQLDSLLDDRWPSYQGSYTLTGNVQPLELSEEIKILIQEYIDEYLKTVLSKETIINY